jgi:tetratricopeptide (TPR) repeat protein
MRSFYSVVVAASLFAASPFAVAHDDNAKAKGPSETFGKVKFPNSCSKAVQAKFTRGVALLHSFWYQETEKTFREVLAEDPSCAIAAWGIAAISMDNPLAGQGASPKNAEAAMAALENARAAGAKTQRERDYIDAVGAYYQDFANRSERERQLARAKAYEALAAKYPKDDEAQIFYALYLSATQSLADRTYAPALKAAAILEQQFKKYPNHPGVAHYLIHSYDYPPIAAQGISAAKRYAKIAPSAPHALHMPSHIFTRVGAWPDAASTNERSYGVAMKSKDFDEALHAADYMAYAYLQMARDGEAKKTLENARQVTGFNQARFVGHYAVSAIPARIAVERGDWEAAAALEPVETKFPFTDAMRHFARALGAARSGKPEAAEKDVEALRRLHGQLVEVKNAYWATEVEVSGLGAAAWLRLAQGKPEEAESFMRQAADMEDKNDKHIVTPGRIVPARELLGDMLLEMKRPADALKEYELSQQREPDRFRGLFGAGTAAFQAGDEVKAKKYFSRLVKIAGKGDPRPELKLARAFLNGG